MREADKACFDTIKKMVKDHVAVIEMDNNINDPEFSEKVAQTLLGFLKK